MKSTLGKTKVGMLIELPLNIRQIERRILFSNEEGRASFLVFFNRLLEDDKKQAVSLIEQLRLISRQQEALPTLAEPLIGYEPLESLRCGKVWTLCLEINPDLLILDFGLGRKLQRSGKVKALCSVRQILTRLENKMVKV